MALDFRPILCALLLLAAAPALAGPYEDGVDAAKRGDFKTAVALFRPLADKGVVEAQYSLGVCYERGLGVPESATEAVKWYKLAAAKGDVRAQYNLAVMAESGRGLKADPAEAAKWYRMAAAKGEPHAQYSLGTMLLDGRGAAKNDAEAASWFRKAADQDLPEAQVALAFMYLNGRGLKQDYQQAFVWATLAAVRLDPAQSADRRARALAFREQAGANMTRPQITEGERMALEWRPPKSATATTPKPPAKK